MKLLLGIAKLTAISLENLTSYERPLAIKGSQVSPNNGAVSLLLYDSIYRVGDKDTYGQNPATGYDTRPLLWLWRSANRLPKPKPRASVQ